MIVIVEGKRSPIGSFNGSLSKIPLTEVTKQVINNLLQETKIHPEMITEMILGQVLTSGFGQNPARQAALLSGIRQESTAYLVNQVCGSGMKAIRLAYQSLLEEEGIILAGGHESMSLAPHQAYLRKSAFGPVKFEDSVVSDGLTDAFHKIHMGLTAEKLAEEYQITREEQDLFALKSQEKAAKAQAEGLFDKEIAPIMIKEDLIFQKDEYIRGDSSLEKLNKLKPAFKKDGGTVTAGNASGINDGSAVLLMMREKTAQRLGLEPLARIVSFAEAGVDPLMMGIGPVFASQKALEKAGWNIADLDLIEANEAFAVQALAVNKLMAWDPTKVNFKGGAIALGHPLGMSGARIVLSLLKELQRQKLKKGLATACIGGGMGIAMTLEFLF
jgi:acetyl-CoA C-acetyltransferase